MPWESKLTEAERAALAAEMAKVDAEYAKRRAAGVCDACPAPATHFGGHWQCCDSCNAEFEELYNQFITGDY